jgi:hypothetical protein
MCKENSGMGAPKTRRVCPSNNIAFPNFPLAIHLFTVGLPIYTLVATSRTTATILPTTDPTWTNMGSNPCLRGEMSN